MYKKAHIRVAVALLLAGTGVLAGAAEKTGPKNVILMIGDGMGFAQIEAAGLYFYGKTEAQPYWAFQPLAMTTWSASGDGYDPERAAKDFKYIMKGATDSAAAATTMSSGVKTLNKRIGEDPDGNNLRHLYEDAEAMGKATGVLTTVYLSHATPAAFATHEKSRNHVEKIAQDMLTKGTLDLLVGAGHPWYDDDHKQIGGLGSAPYKTAGSYDRLGGEALWRSIREGSAGGDADGDGSADPWYLVDNLAGFESLAAGAHTGERILGVLPVATTLQLNRSGDKNAAPYAVPLTPDLPDMALLMKGALNVLSQDPEGFFLMAEGGAIDWACHGNNFGRLIEEQHDFDRAIAAVVTWVEKNSSWEDTLLIITADHETGYLCGPGSDPELRPLENNGKGKVPGYEWHSKHHTNQPVPLFSKGNGAEKFLGMIKGQDVRRGPYVDNADVPKVIRAVWR